MATPTPFALLVTAASASECSPDRLLRTAMLVARCVKADDMAAWCSVELAGYAEVSDVPEYRKASAVLKATDAYGRDLPVYFKDTKAKDRLTTCPVMQGIASVADCANVGDDTSFQVQFVPEVEKELLQHMPGYRTVFRVVQRASFANVIAAVRQRIFHWAVDRLHEDAQLPGGVDAAAMLGLKPEAKSPDAAPVEPRNGIDLSNAQLSGTVQIVVNSAGSHASLVNTQGIDTAGLKELVGVLTAAIQATIGKDSSAEALVAPVQQLREVLEMTQPRPSWIKEAFKTVRTVIEGAGGALLAELTKPQVQALLLQLQNSSNSWG